jgi:hypothetical protein
LEANDADPGHQSATSHIPKTNAGIEKITCKLFIIKREGELEKAELLVSGPINRTAEKLTINAQIAINIVISWTKYLPLDLTHMLTKIKPVHKVCIIRLISAKLNPSLEKGKNTIAPIVTKTTVRMVRPAIFPCEE